MPLSGCTNGVVATVLLAILFLPVQYYVPDLYVSEPEAVVAPPTSAYSFELPQITDYPVLDTFIAFTFTFSLLTIFICDWVQRKVLERRIVKLNQHLKESVTMLREYDMRQEQMEKMLHAVKKATAEYSLLLYLLLRRHRLAPHEPPPADCFLDKHLNEYPFAGGSAMDL